MILVRIELCPFGEEKDKKLIEEIRIGNDGTGDNIIGNYKFITSVSKKRGSLKNFFRSRGAIELVKDILRKF
jgi:hypothetical protein